MIISTSTALIRLGVSLVLGFLIGLERQAHKHPAGVRTFSLICVGSALAMITSIYICQTNTDLLNGDPGRIAAQVITGIGFLGAGLIIKNADGISGLTTAACIFTTAIIGLAAGAGLLLIAAIVTAASELVLIYANFIKGHDSDHDSEKKKD